MAQSNSALDLYEKQVTQNYEAYKATYQDQQMNGKASEQHGRGAAGQVSQQGGGPGPEARAEVEAALVN